MSKRNQHDKEENPSEILNKFIEKTFENLEISFRNGWEKLSKKDDKIAMYKSYEKSVGELEKTDDIQGESLNFREGVKFGFFTEKNEKSLNDFVKENDQKTPKDLISENIVK